MQLYNNNNDMHILFRHEVATSCPSLIIRPLDVSREGLKFHPSIDIVITPPRTAWLRLKLYRVSSRHRRHTANV